MTSGWRTGGIGRRSRRREGSPDPFYCVAENGCGDPSLRLSLQLLHDAGAIAVALGVDSHSLEHGEPDVAEGGAVGED